MLLQSGLLIETTPLVKHTPKPCLWFTAWVLLWVGSSAGSGKSAAMSRGGAQVSSAPLQKGSEPTAGMHSWLHAGSVQSCRDLQAEGRYPIPRDPWEQGSRAARSPAALEQASSTLIMVETGQNSTEATKLWQQLHDFIPHFPAALSKL